MSAYQDAVQAFYMCGLEEAAAAEAAKVVGMPSRPNTAADPESGFDNPSWALYRYWLSQDPFCHLAQTSADLHGMLRALRFRPEVIPLAVFQEAYIPHLDSRNWARRLALGVYKETSSIPPMPQARL